LTTSSTASPHCATGSANPLSPFFVYPRSLPSIPANLLHFIRPITQPYNVQATVDQASLFIVATSVSNHPNDPHEVALTVDAISPSLGTPTAGALDHGYFSERNIAALEARGIEPCLATGREPHQHGWQSWFAEQPLPPFAEASATVKMAYKLQTEIGNAIYGLRKMTVEPVIGIVKEVLGFWQFSLRGLVPVAGEWCLVCLAYDLKRLHVLLTG
jgi:Transposase DDE domain